MKKVIVTGAFGFIGRHCLPLLLERGYEVHAVDIKDDPKLVLNGPLHRHFFDLLDEQKRKSFIEGLGASHLLHFAWYTEHKKYWTSAENFRWVNASLKLLEEFKKTGGSRALIAGTCAEYDWTRGVCSEAKTPLLPATLYGAARHSFQSMACAYAKVTGFSLAWGRIFFVYGPYENQNRIVPAVIRSMLLGKDIGCTHCKQKRDLLYVSDVAGAFAALLDSNVEGAVNIGSGKAVSFRHVIEEIMKRTGRKGLVHFGQISAPADDPLLLVADTRRLNNEVGWRPLVSLDNGLDMTIDWWKQALNEVPRNG